jgi:hypothetical protein
MSKLDTIIEKMNYSGWDSDQVESYKQEFKDIVLEIIYDFTEEEDIPNQHSPAEYIGDVYGLRQRIKEL